MKPDIASIKLTCFKPDVYEPSDVIDRMHYDLTQNNITNSSIQAPFHFHTSMQDSFLLVDALVDLAKTWPINWPSISLEVGCGTGYVICSLALALHSLGHTNAHYLATDINPSATSATLTTLNAHHNNTTSSPSPTHKVDILTTDLVSPLHPRLCGLIDLLIFNPPYVPTPDDEVLQGGIAASWAGGDRGRLVIDRLMPLVPELLSPTGEMVMIALDENDPQELIEMMEKKGFHGASIAQRAADEEHLHVLRFWRKKE